MSYNEDLSTYAPVKRPLDSDKLAMVPRDKATSAAHLSLFQVQDLPPEEAVLGTAVLYRVLCERSGKDPEDLYRMAGRVLDAPEDGDRPTDNSLQSLKDFAGARIMGQAVSYR